MMRGELLGCGRANSLSPVPSGCIRPMRLPRFGEPERPVVRNRDRGRAAAGVGQRKLGDAVGLRRRSALRVRAPPNKYRYPKRVSAVTSTYSHKRRARICHRLMKVKLPFTPALVAGVALLATAASILPRSIDGLRLQGGPPRAVRPARHGDVCRRRARARPEVLRHLPQRAAEDRRTVARQDPSISPRRRSRGRLGEGRRKLRGGMMPPQGMPRPDAATLDAFAASLEDSLDRRRARSRTRPQAGPSPESHGVRQRGPRPARSRHRRDEPAAGRR